MHCSAPSPLCILDCPFRRPLIRQPLRSATYPPGEGFFLQFFPKYAKLLHISIPAGDSMSTLFIGFKGSHNPSCQLVTALPGDKLLLTNSIPGLTRDIADIPKTYDTVYLFGIDKTLKNTIRIETCAQAEDHILVTALDPVSLQTVLTYCGLPAIISHTPTHYLCNEAYYQLLQKFHANALLIHIPGLRHMTGETMQKLILAFRPPA